MSNFKVKASHTQTDFLVAGKNPSSNNKKLPVWVYLAMKFVCLQDSVSTEHLVGLQDGVSFARHFLRFASLASSSGAAGVAGNGGGIESRKL